MEVVFMFGIIVVASITGLIFVFCAFLLGFHLGNSQLDLRNALLREENARLLALRASDRLAEKLRKAGMV
jgi:hypothetical protein